MRRRPWGRGDGRRPWDDQNAAGSSMVGLVVVVEEGKMRVGGRWRKVESSGRVHAAQGGVEAPHLRFSGAAFSLVCLAIFQN